MNRSSDDVSPPCEHAPLAGSRAERLTPPDPAVLERAAEFFRAAGDEGRLRLLAALEHGELCVTDLAALTGEGMSTISQRLRVLRSAGLVARRREHKHVLYSLADDHIAQLIRSALDHAGEPEPRSPNIGEPGDRPSSDDPAHAGFAEGSSAHDGPARSRPADGGAETSRGAPETTRANTNP